MQSASSSPTKGKVDISAKTDKSRSTKVKEAEAGSPSLQVKWYNYVVWVNEYHKKSQKNDHNFNAKHFLASPLSSSVVYSKVLWKCSKV